MYGFKIKGEEAPPPRPAYAREYLLGKPIGYDEGAFVYDGVHHQDYEDIFLSGIFGFCGCGNASGALRYIASVLRYNVNERALGDLYRKEHPTGYDQVAWSAHCEEAWAREASVCGSRDAATIIYYVLTQKDFMEHGGSVPGWLTPKGDELLSALEEYFATVESKRNE